MPTPPQPINAQNTWHALENWISPEQLAHYAQLGVIEEN
jgi:hypothetical protein